MVVAFTDSRILSNCSRRGNCDCSVMPLKCVNEVTIDNLSAWFFRDYDKTQFFTRLRITARKPVKLRFYVILFSLRGNQHASHAREWQEMVMKNTI